MVKFKTSGLMAKNQNTSKTVKFLCSYGGKILPRSSDGHLRYIGGVIRVLSVDRSISFSEILVKLGELCNSSVILKCQLPTEDLDALISVTSDEDLVNIIEEYDIASKASSSSVKIRAFLSPPKSLKKISPPSSVNGSPTGKYFSQFGKSTGFLLPNHQICSTPVGFPVGLEKSTMTRALLEQYQYAYISQGCPRPVYLVHNGNHSHWQ